MSVWHHTVCRVQLNCSTNPHRPEVTLNYAIICRGKLYLQEEKEGRRTGCSSHFTEEKKTTTLWLELFLFKCSNHCYPTNSHIIYYICITQFYIQTFLHAFRIEREKTHSGIYLYIPDLKLEPIYIADAFAAQAFPCCWHVVTWVKNVTAYLYHKWNEYSSGQRVEKSILLSMYYAIYILTRLIWQL